jgi:hypothetical protein
MDELLTADNVPCQCEIYEICRKCAPTPEAYERAWQQRLDALKEHDDGTDDIS